MDFSEAMAALGERAQKLKGNLNTEEATKTALVLPFIKELGYDIFNPLEVVPEFTADVADLKGEKIDYAIMQDGKPIMIIECKCCGVCLDETKQKQLHRYFLTLDSSIGILTDGIRWLFYSSGDDGKRMDSSPFMEFNLEDIDLSLLPELRKLCKGKFDLERTLQTVNELKFNRQIKMVLAQNLDSPQDNFVGYFMREFNVRAYQKAVEQFTVYVKRAFTEFVNEQVDMRLKNALAATSQKKAAVSAPELAEETDANDNKIVTTDEEREGFQVVRAIMCKVVDPSRVHMRDTMSYCGILLDNKNNRPICRLHFNAASVKYIETFDADKKGTKHKIEAVSDIYKHEDALRAVVEYYEKA